MRFAALTIVFAFLFVFFSVPFDNGETFFEKVTTQGQFEGFSDEQDVPENVSLGGEEPLQQLEQKETIEESTGVAPPPQSPQENESQSSASETIETATLSAAGVLRWTNFYRNEAGLESLSANSRLDTASRIKVYDMFDGQYFEHVSPSGVDVSDVVERVEYDYIAVGENLALGDFQTSKDLVDAWMASPGHRENILKPNYEEIGIALQRGEYRGNTVWLSAQTFAKPRSSCTSPSEELRSRIDSERNRADRLSTRIGELRAELQDSQDETRAEYNRKVARYNELAQELNELNANLRTLTSRYNEQVDAFNTCASN